MRKLLPFALLFLLPACTNLIPYSDAHPRVAVVPDAVVFDSQNSAMWAAWQASPEYMAIRNPWNPQYRPGPTVEWLDRNRFTHVRVVGADGVHVVAVHYVTIPTLTERFEDGVVAVLIRLFEHAPAEGAECHP